MKILAIKNSNFVKKSNPFFDICCKVLNQHARKKMYIRGNNMTKNEF